MPSFTSSSERKIPAWNYGAFWLGTAVLAVLMLLAGEIYWRGRGMNPSIVDDKAFWAYHRDRVYSRDGKPRLVVLGHSRSTFGIVPEVLKKEFPDYEVIHLGVNQLHAFESLRDLAGDPDFTGVILAVANADSFLDGMGDQKEWVHYYWEKWRNREPVERSFNLRVKHFIQNRWVIFKAMNPARQLRFLSSEDLPADYIRIGRDRFHAAFHKRLTAEQLADLRRHVVQWRKKEILRYAKNPDRSLEQFEKNLKKELLPLISQLKAKGGKIIFIRMPTAAEVWKIDEEALPKKLYWDKLERLSGVPAIHFKDYPQLSGFDCPDGSHLDADNATLFTHRLAQIIKQKKLLESRADQAQGSRGN